jgi:hypothetical protein
MPSTHTPAAPPKEPRVLETCRGTAHPVRLGPGGRR